MRPVSRNCGGIPGPMLYTLTPDRMTFSDNAEGGRVTLGQVLHGPQDTPGSVLVLGQRAESQ